MPDDYYGVSGDEIVYSGNDGVEVLTRGGIDDDLSLDTVFSLLKEQRRRLVLRYFFENPAEEADQNDVVDYVLGWEKELGIAPPDHRRNVEISLRHNHLPKLEEAHVVEFDESTGNVLYHGSDRLERFVSVAIDESPLP